MTERYSPGPIGHFGTGSRAGRKFTCGIRGKRSYFIGWVKEIDYELSIQETTKLFS